ncbi:hypothetical protein DRN44_00925 [Thermococci archaeon]|nr:MAG: hypothetical protein DRN44_00925 [Thermococci archaeon]
MDRAKITFMDSRFDSLKLETSNSYPRKKQLILKAHYEKIQFEFSGHVYDLAKIFDSIVFYLLQSNGYIEFSNPHNNRLIRISAKIRKGKYQDKDFEIVSEPLPLEEINEIDDVLNSETIQLNWRVEGYFMLDRDFLEHLKYSSDSGIQKLLRDLRNVKIYLDGLIIPISFVCSQKVELSRQDFVRNVLEPADMLQREFIEVVVEPINEEEIDKIPHPEYRETLKLLLNKQKILLEALKKLRYANSAEEYRSVISDVRNAIEGLTTRKMSESQLRALQDAVKVIPLVRDVNPLDKIDEVASDITDTLVGENASFSQALFKYSSKLATHTTQGRGDESYFYTPVPRREEAKFAVLQAVLLLNYLISLIKRAALNK